LSDAGTLMADPIIPEPTIVITDIQNTPLVLILAKSIIMYYHYINSAFSCQSVALKLQNNQFYHCTFANFFKLFHYGDCDDTI